MSLTKQERRLIDTALSQYAPTTAYNPALIQILRAKILPPDSPRKPRASPHQAKLPELQALLVRATPLKHAAKQLGIARSTAYRLLSKG